MTAEGIICTCPEWQSHRTSLTSLLRETPIHYCPWCGQRLLAPDAQRDEAFLEKYRKRINENFFSTDKWGMPLFYGTEIAAQSVDDYRQLTGDISGTLDLMLTFVEAGTRFTNEYGDIDEEFYDGLETMLDNFRDLLLANPDLYEEGNISLRLPKLARAAGQVGWGYGDYVSEQVAEIMGYFGDD